MKNNALSLLFICVAILTLSACGETIETEAKYPTGADRNTTSGNNIYDKPDSIFGKGGLLGSSRKSGEGDGGSGIAVNSFLWRAALDTVSFMPLASADPFGGTILTDWYTPAENTNERFKINVFILGRQLRSDGVRVRVFKQQLKGGTWKDVDSASDTARQLEDTILTRARQLRVAQIGDIEE